MFPPEPAGGTIMIPRKELKRWLAGADAQDATAARLGDVAKRLKALPLLQHLRDALDGLAEPDAAAVLACARRAISDEAGIAQIMACLIEAAAADPFFRPAVRSVATDIHSGLLLFETPILTLFLSVMPPEGLAAKRLERDGQRSIVFPGHQSLYRFVRSGGATFSFWEAPPIEADFTAASSGRCRLVDRRRISDGEILQIDGRRQSFVIDHASADLVYFHAVTSAGRAPLTVEYDDLSLEFSGASSTDEVSSRTQMMLALLRTLDRQDAVPLMIDMLGDTHFYARWHAMRELLALDAEAALPHLSAMAKNDPHSDVRAAAQATLAACFPPPRSPDAAIASVLEMH